MKKILCISFTLAALALTESAARTLMVAPQGGNWSSNSTWLQGDSPTTAPTPGEYIELRAQGSSAPLIVDTDAYATSVSMWGSDKSIEINSGVSLTVGDKGINLQNITTSISGAGTLTTSSGNLIIYGGNSNASAQISSNAIISKVTFSGNYFTDDTVSTVVFNASGSNTLTTKLQTSGSKNDGFTVSGGKSINSVVKITGNAKLGDITISNNGRLVIDSNNFVMNGTYNKVEVHASVIELVGGKSSPYSIYSKIRLNGASTLILTGDNAYTNLTNIVFNSGNDWNKIVVNGTTNMAGLCVYDKTSLAEKTIIIELGEVAEGQDYVLHLEHLTTEAKNASILATDSLTKTTTSAGTASQVVEGMFVEFINFDNGKVKLDNDLLTAEDWDHVKSDGWENFRLENGYITADRIAVPEPAQCAAILAVLALALALRRRVSR